MNTVYFFPKRNMFFTRKDIKTMIATIVEQGSSFKGRTVCMVWEASKWQHCQRYLGQKHTHLYRKSRRAPSRSMTIVARFSISSKPKVFTDTRTRCLSRGRYVLSLVVIGGDGHVDRDTDAMRLGVLRFIKYSAYAAAIMAGLSGAAYRDVQGCGVLKLPPFTRYIVCCRYKPVIFAPNFS